MEFGKLDDISHVDFRLPPDDLRSLTGQQARGTRPDSRRVFVGAPVWACKDWVGSFYPPKTSPRDFLTNYAMRFNSIELNSTHYGTPRLETVIKWRDSTSPGFRFCPKVPQEISHRKGLVGVGQDTVDFLRAMEAFGDRLGCTFLQLPPQFGVADLPRLRAWLRTLPPEFEIAVEFRDAAFFGNGALEARAFDLLAAAGAHAVITDVAGRRDVLHSTCVGDSVFLRLILNDLHPTDFARAKAWTERLAVWTERGLKTAYLFIHQPADVSTPAFAKSWIPELNERLGLVGDKRVREIESPSEPKAPQLSLFD